MAQSYVVLIQEKPTKTDAVVYWYAYRKREDALTQCRDLAHYQHNQLQAKGQPAYVAVDGTVYDVSGKDAWKGGKHHGNLAGRDLTDVLWNKSPHKDSVLSGLPVVGKLTDDE